MPRIADSSFSEVHLGEQDEADPQALDPDRPFRILLAGDFSGRSWRDNPPRPFTPQRIDRDNFDDVLGAMKVSLNLHGITLSFRELEDFHPDRIYQSTPLFQDLDRHLERLDPPKAAPPPVAPRAASSGSLLDQMLDEHEPAPESPVSLQDAEDLASFIQRVTKGHLEPRPDPAKQQLVAKREALATELLQGILHHPRMQAIEAAWRALFLLIRGLETDGDLQLHVLDITLPELVSEMGAVQKELRRKGPWALIAGNYTFAQTELDAQVLQRLAASSIALRASASVSWSEGVSLAGVENSTSWGRRPRRRRLARLSWPKRNFLAKKPGKPGSHCAIPRKPAGLAWRCPVSCCACPTGSPPMPWRAFRSKRCRGANTDLTFGATRLSFAPTFSVNRFWSRGGQ